MDETWKPVPSLEGVMASSKGRLQLPSRTAQMPQGGFREYHPKPTYGFIKKANKTARRTYRGIGTRFFGNIKIHRAVCEAFHGPRPFDGAVVIHLDENSDNNRPENLKWGTQKENLNMPGFVKYCKSRTGENSPRRKAAKKLAHKRIKQKYNAKPTAQEKAYHIWLRDMATCACGCMCTAEILHHPLTRHPEQRWRRDHEFVVPMTARCHMDLHASGKEPERFASLAAKYREMGIENGKL